MADTRIPKPTTAHSAYDALRGVQREIELRLASEGKNEDWFPAWYLHLPGQMVRIRRFEKEGALLRFTTPEGDSILIAPEALVLRIEEQHEGDSFPVAWVGEDEADELPPAA